MVIVLEVDLTLIVAPHERSDNYEMKVQLQHAIYRQPDRKNNVISSYIKSNLTAYIAKPVKTKTVLYNYVL